MVAKKAVMPGCPCGSGQDYTKCCGRYHAGQAAPTAEARMRSRYAAYVLRLAPYLQATWHAGTCPAVLELDDAIRWIGLEIKQHERTGPDQAIVEFVARYKLGGRAHRLHETSRFERTDGRWQYVDGSFPDEAEAEDAR